MAGIVNAQVIYRIPSQRTESEAEKRNRLAYEKQIRDQEEKRRKDEEKRKLDEEKKRKKEEEKQKKEEEKRRKNEEKKRKKEEERRRREDILRSRTSRLDRFTVWCVKKTAGTALKKPLYSIVGTTTGHLAVAITVSIFLGIIFNQILIYLFGNATSSSYNYATCAFISFVVAAAAGGAGGAIVGAIWGWLIGSISDATASYFTNEQLKEFIGTFAAWFISAVVGWFIGKVSARIYDSLTIRHGRIQSIIEKIFVTIALASIGLFLIGLINWFFFQQLIH
jgi:hypothetical protein